MPCWEVNLMSVEFKVGNKKTLLKMLTSEKIAFRVNESANTVTFTRENKSYVVDYKNHTIETEAGRWSNAVAQDGINKVKQMFSAFVVKQVARKNKWAVRVKGQNKFKLAKY